MSVELKFQEIISSIMGNEAIKDWQPNLRLEDIGADSIDEMEIFMEIEKEFEIEISDDNAVFITKSVAEMMDYIAGRLK